MHVEGDVCSNIYCSIEQPAIAVHFTIPHPSQAAHNDEQNHPGRVASCKLPNAIRQFGFEKHVRSIEMCAFFQLSTQGGAFLSEMKKQASLWLVAVPVAATAVPLDFRD